MKPSDEVHHLSLIFERMKGDNDRLLKFVESLRNPAIAYLKKVIPTDADLTNYEQAGYYCYEIQNNPEHAPYRSAAQVLSTCNHALRTGKVNQDHIRVIIGSWGGLDKAEEWESLIKNHFGKAGQKGGSQPKSNKPIFIAITEYMKKNPKTHSIKIEEIARKFCGYNKASSPMEITIDETIWEVFYDGEKIVSRPVERHGKGKANNKEKSIEMTTFRNAYVSKAKKLFPPTIENNLL